MKYSTWFVWTLVCHGIHPEASDFRMLVKSSADYATIKHYNTCVQTLKKSVSPLCDFNIKADTKS